MQWRKMSAEEVQTACAEWLARRGQQVRPREDFVTVCERRPTARGDLKYLAFQVDELPDGDASSASS